MSNSPPNFDQQKRALEWAVSLVTPQAKKSAQLLTAYVQQQPKPSQPTKTPGVYHLLYCSQAVAALGEEQMADLLERSQANNDQVELTEMLCYDNGRFV